MYNREEYMKIEPPNTSAIIALLLAGLAVCNTIRIEMDYKKQIEVLEHYTMLQQEIICMNKDSLPIQYQEHKDFCLGVAGSVALRH